MSSKNRIKFSYGHKISAYTIFKCIGEGGYGDVYYAINNRTKTPVAIKIEDMQSRKQGICKEVRIFSGLDDSPFFPKFYEKNEYRHFRYLVIELLGPSFGTIKKALPQKKFTPYTFFAVSIKMLEAIRSFHQCGFIHRDIKPSNFLLRPGSPEFLCLLDFGLSRTYLDTETHGILPPNIKGGFRGTLPFCSPHTHHHKDQGRRDDIYSWFYTLTFLYTGSLPWGSNKHHHAVDDMKKNFTTSKEFLELPSKIQEIYGYIQTMKFLDQPDYSYMIGLLNEARAEMNIPQDRSQPYDWELLPIDVQQSISIFPLAMKPESTTPFPLKNIVNFDEIREKKLEKREKEKSMEQKNSPPMRESSVCLLL